MQVELPADVAAMFCINLVGRRWSVSLGMLLCGLAMVASAAAPGLVIMSDNVRILSSNADGCVEMSNIIMSGHQANVVLRCRRLGAGGHVPGGETLRHLLHGRRLPVHGTCLVS